ncbi:MAG TPA: alanine racemase [Syntrophorhabdaceae bacterium]|nr:alanine racemase [Syntrophorhabdaceae bacterium]HQM80338.1 alanine racemase [Syntrophorhabdaceae bacterium]
MRTTAYIDLGVLEENYRTIRARVPQNVKVLCVVKADAYGHGAVQVSRRLEENGVDYLGVANVEEGTELRKAGIKSPILVMGGILPWDPEEPFDEHDLVPVIYDTGMIEKLKRKGSRSGKTLKVHIKVDTGMGRLGFRPEEVPDIARLMKKLPHIEIEGCMSHFSSSEVRDEYGLNQIRIFEKSLQALQKEGIALKIAHMANSGAITNYPEGYFDMIRVGISLYGSHPAKELSTKLPVRQVMRFVSKVALIREFPPGSPLSYGRTFTTSGRTRVAYIPVGYADGYPRALSNKGSVLIKGKRCNIVGRICMDWFLVDITDIGNAATGDEVVLLGHDGTSTITADEIAECAGTIPYEILCKISKRVARVYV